MAKLRGLQAKALADAGETKAPLKTFKDYEPGFLHMGIKYLPQMPDERERRYLFVAIDRATRWRFMHLYADQGEDSRVGFLNRLDQLAPIKIIKLLTDNGSLCPPRHPQTNGMLKRFNARISEVLNKTRFSSAAELEATLLSYMKTYNHLIPQRALKHASPFQVLKDWLNKKPELFKKLVYNQPELDM